jgi:hypothetical protein
MFENRILFYLNTSLKILFLTINSLPNYTIKYIQVFVIVLRRCFKIYLTSMVLSPAKYEYYSFYYCSSKMKAIKVIIFETLLRKTSY